MAASGRVRPPGLESEVPEEETAEMKTEEKKADDDDKESLSSLERQDTDVRFQKWNGLGSPINGQLRTIWMTKTLGNTNVKLLH